MILRKNALVIQEDIIILKILERMISSKNFNCKAITSLAQLDIEDQQTNFDLILTDILFEGISPLEFISQVQEVILHKNLLVVTNMGQDNVKRKILDLEGISGFFSVPLDLDEIETLIETY